MKGNVTLDTMNLSTAVTAGPISGVTVVPGTQTGVFAGIPDNTPATWNSPFTFDNPPGVVIPVPLWTLVNGAAGRAVRCS
jgi:hypothetical protein